MSISVRKRGEIWHARGTVRVGRETIHVREFSTGSSTRSGALAAAADEEARIRREHLEGPQARKDGTTVAACLTAYLKRPKGVPIGDRRRIVELGMVMGDKPLSAAPGEWQRWLETRGRGLAPSTSARTLATLRAALTHGCKALEAGPPPQLQGVSQPRRTRLPYLTDDERSRLLAAYTPAAGRVALALAYQGLRTQEALRLDWRHVDLIGGAMRIDDTKSGHGRSVPLHPIVAAMLAGIRSGKTSGPVFLSSRGQPYADTRGRDGGQQGGNPLKRAHDSACRKAGVLGFRVHDWRHDWATRMVTKGTSMVALMQLGGWRTMRMVERYVTIESGRLRDDILRLD